MYYAKIANKKVIEYPVSQSSIREILSGISLPESISPQSVEDYGFYPVKPSNKPDFNPLKEKVKEGIPEFIGKNWVQTWITTELSDTEIDSMRSQKEKEVKEIRDQLLAKSDWTQLADVSVDQKKWRLYRESLREITKQTGFPYNVDWPKEPS